MFDKNNMDKECKQPGLLEPIINLNKCEGAGPCLDVCPYGVLELKPITNEELKELSFIGKTKTWFHGQNKAYVVDVDLCQACGLCVTACPEKAITLKRNI